MDAIVVSDQKTAIECIRYMKDQRAGQATFLPLDSLSVKPINEKYRTFVKGAQLAIDLLESDGSIDLALQFACGSALICDTLETAKHICYDKKQEVKGTLSIFFEISCDIRWNSNSQNGHDNRWKLKKC